MKITVKRRYLDPDYTIGSMFIDGAYFCDTLEDTTRDLNKNGVLDGTEKKIMHQTSIPYGTYDVIVNVSPRFGRELPRLINVPHFDGILIHRGNTADHTSGCILVGENKIKGQVINSTQYEVELVQRCKQAIVAGQTIKITIE